MTLENIRFSSNTGIGEIEVHSFLPKKADIYMIIVHGMAEHSQRYNHFANYLKDNNIGVFTFDLPGHGKTINTKDDLGYFGDKGYENIIKDIDYIVHQVKENIPKDKKLILFGHSMGSIIVRKYSSLANIPIDGAIYCGTLGYNNQIDTMIKECEKVGEQSGFNTKDENLNNILGNILGESMAFEAKTPLDWLSRDDEVVKVYMDDPLCGFMFSAGGFRDMFSWLKDITNETWGINVKNMPILIISGDKDPAGNNGEGPKEAEEFLIKGGKNPKLLLYKDARHEVLNELNKEEVYQDILEFLQNIE